MAHNFALAVKDNEHFVRRLLYNELLTQRVNLARCIRVYHIKVKQI